MLDSASVARLCPCVFKAGGEGDHPVSTWPGAGWIADSCASVVQCHLLLHLSVVFVAAFALSRCRCGWADHTGSADREL